MSDTPPYPETPLQAAQMYGVSGWRVVPIQIEKKAPAILEWTKRASKDPEVITNWWTNDYAQCGVGIVTGKETGMWVLDVDVAKGKRGRETLAALIEAHGGGKLPDTLVVRTPTGGWHYYWKYPQEGEIHNAQELGPGLDVRAEGGQVLAPPTTRGAGSYYWVEGHGPYDVEVLNAPRWLLELVVDKVQVPYAEVADAPAWLLELVVDRVQVPYAEVVLDQQRFAKDEPTYVTRYNQEHPIEAVLTEDGWTFSHSDSNDVSYWTRPGKDKREGTSASTNYAGLGCLYSWTTSIPWLPSERMYDSWGYMVHRDFGGDFKAAGRGFYERTKEPVPVLVPNADQGIGAPVPSEGTDEGTETLTAMQALAVDFSPDGPFWNQDLDASDWLIAPFIARGRGHALYASGKVGKSFIALQAIAAACIPGHTSWADPVKEPIKVLYLDYEMTQADLYERLEMFGYSKEDDLSRFHYIMAAGLGADLDTDMGGELLLAHALYWGVDLVVVDTMSRAVRGAENDADTVRDFYRCTGTRLKAHGIAMQRLDHAGKELERGQRGTSGKNDDVDIVWQLSRTNDGARFDLTHTRMSWVPPEIVLAYQETDDGLACHVRAQGSYPAGVREKAEEWLALGIPVDASRAAARKAGLECKNTLFSSVRRFLMENEAKRLIWP